MHPHLQSCHWLVRTNQRMPCCLPAMYQFGQDDIKFLVLRVKDHMKTDVLITASCHRRRNDLCWTFQYSKKKKKYYLNVFLYGFFFNPEACLKEISHFGSLPYNPHFSKMAPLRFNKQSQQARIWSMSAHCAVKQQHVKAQCYPYMRPCEIQHDKSNFIEWDRSPLVWLT